jgi:hypothetical protein
MPASPPRENRLATFMESRRRELALKWIDIANAAGLSTETLRAARRKGQVPTGLTRLAIDRGLQWAPGSTDRIIEEDGAPEPLPPGAEPESAGQPRPARRLADAAATVFSDDPVAAAIMAQEHKPMEQRKRELAKWLAGEGEAANG